MSLLYSWHRILGAAITALFIYPSRRAIVPLIWKRLAWGCVTIEFMILRSDWLCTSRCTAQQYLSTLRTCSDWDVNVSVQWALQALDRWLCTRVDFSCKRVDFSSTYNNSWLLSLFGRYAWILSQSSRYFATLFSQIESRLSDKHAVSPGSTQEWIMWTWQHYRIDTIKVIANAWCWYAVLPSM